MISKGDLIACSTPFVFALCAQERQKRCEQCFRILESKIPCYKCLNVSFCSRKCQKDSQMQENHSSECAVLATRPLSTVARLIARVVTKVNQKHCNPEEMIGNYRRDWDCLMDHYDDIVRDVTAMYQFDAVFSELELIFGNSLPDIRKIIRIYGKILINSFAVQDELMQPIGRAVYLGPSIFDHSCAPSAAYVFIGTTIFIKAIKDIPGNDIRDARISYIDELESTGERLRQLRAAYYFECDCERCREISPFDTDELECLRPIVDKLEKFFDTDYYNRFDLSRRNSVAMTGLYKSALKTRNRDEKLRLISEARNEMKSLRNVLEIRIASIVALHDKDLNLSLRVADAYRNYYGKSHPRLALRLLVTARLCDKHSPTRKRLLFEARNIAYLITPSYAQFQSFTNNMVVKEDRSRTIFKCSHIYKISDSLSNLTLLSIIENELNDCQKLANNMVYTRSERSNTSPLAVSSYHTNATNTKHFKSRSTSDRLRSRSCTRDYRRLCV